MGGFSLRDAVTGCGGEIVNDLEIIAIFVSKNVKSILQNRSVDIVEDVIMHNVMFIK